MALSTKAERNLSKVSDDTFIYVNNQLNSHDVFDYLIDKCEGADRLFVSSFAITETYIRRFIKNRYRIKHITLLLDFTVATRQSRNTYFASQNVDELRLTNNHSKIILIENKAVAIMSNNATDNSRYECGFVSFNSEMVSKYTELIKTMLNDTILYE
jgi:hypothetical protein